MEFGAYQLQIFTSLVVILGAAFVALICDFLKGNNEQLRELAIELKVRREEEQRRTQTMTAHPANTARAAVETPQTPPAVAATHEKIESRLPRPMAVPGERKRTASADAIAAMERGAAMAGARRSKPAEDRVVESPAGNKPEPRMEMAAEPAPVIDVTPEPAPRPAAAPAGAPSGKKDWNSLLTRRAEPKPAVEVQTDLIDAVAAATINQRNHENFPAGFQDGFVLSQLVQSRKPVSGLVVSVGVSAPRNQDGSLPEQVRTVIQSLIGPDDFACQSSEEEFLLIYPGERGASAQRRLSQIAQQLWDFQLRSLGKFSILFSWGGVEVRSESIEEAIASANERMQETRRGRKLLTMEPRENLRQAV